MDQENIAPVPVFISYSHRDEKYREALETHLALLQRTGVIQTWHDHKIGPGNEWQSAIESHLKAAKIILLLLSPDFIASDYCWSKELKYALELHDANRARVVPVILRPCEWQRTRLGGIKALPRNGREIAKWRHRDDAYLDVVQGLRAALTELRSVAPAGTPVTEIAAPLPSPLPTKTAARFLRIEAGMHTAPINRIDIDDAGHFLVTGSDDKTVRVWDLASGKQLRVLRPPIGEGDEGKIYAVAITPDGELVAAGGWTSSSGIDENIYIFDRRTGRLARRIGGLPIVVNHLAFSPNGKRLAATLWGTNGLRVFRTSDGSELFRDIEPKAGSYGCAFDAEGRLVTSSNDGQLRLYAADHRKLATREAPGGKQPYSIAFSPNGRQIAVGYHDTNCVDVLSGSSLELFFSADTTGTNNNLMTIAWSVDGAFLFAAGRYVVHDRFPIHSWLQAGRGQTRDLPGPYNTVTGLCPLADGRLALGSADPAWRVLTASGEPSLGGEAPQADFRNLLDGFRIDHRGERVRFAYEATGKRPAVFSLRERRLILDPPAGDRFEGELLTAPRTSAPGLEISSWVNATEPRCNGTVLPLDTYETSRSLAIAADGQSFLLGADWTLRVFRADGTALWPKPKPIPSVAWAVNLTLDGRLALAAFGDGTIRWFRARDGEELLAFFPHRDGRRWVLWTPSGYYDASVDGEDLIGWHVNRGPDQAADFFSAWHFRDTYHRPDVIDLVLETLDEAEALRRAGVARG